MKTIIISFLMIACGESFEPQLFSAPINTPETEPVQDAANDIIYPSVDSGIESSTPFDSQSESSVIDANPITARCCGTGTQPDPICSECPSRADGTCTLEGLGCRMFWPSDWTSYVCMNGQWQKGEIWIC